MARIRRPGFRRLPTVLKKEAAAKGVSPAQINQWLQLGLNVAGIIGKIPVSKADPFAEEISGLEQEQQTVLEQAAAARAKLREEEIVDIGKKATELQDLKAKTELMEAADRRARGFAEAAQRGGLSLGEMTSTTERMAGLPLAAFARRQAVDGVVSDTVLPGQSAAPATVTSPARRIRRDDAPETEGVVRLTGDGVERPGAVRVVDSAQLPLPPGLTREDITRGNVDILNKAASFKLEDFVQNPAQAAAEIDARFSALVEMTPASVEEHLERTKQMARLRDEKTVLLGMGRLGKEGQAALRSDIETSERELADAPAAEVRRAEAITTIDEAEKAAISEIENELSALRVAGSRTLHDVIADARLVTTEKDKRRLIKEAASVITPRNVKESIFGVDALKLQAVEKVLKQMPKSLTEKELQDIANKRSLVKFRDAKRRREDELQPAKLKEIRSRTAYRDARKTMLEEFKPFEKTKLQEQIKKLRKEQKRINKAGVSRDPGFTQAVGALRSSLLSEVTRLQKMVDIGENAKSFRDHWAGAKPIAPDVTQYPTGEFDPNYTRAVKDYDKKLHRWNMDAVKANVNFDLFGKPEKLSKNKSELQIAKDKLDKFIKQYGGTPIESTSSVEDFKRAVEESRGDFE